jgi:GntR family transcriptional regulator, transcriptional repressor for pyruvate dehydrogenase complex
MSDQNPALPLEANESSGRPAPAVAPARQAYQYLVGLIDTLQSGDRLPSERAIADSLDISRQTVRTAFDRLTREGRISRRIGSGSYVEPRQLPSGPAAGAVPDVGIIDVIEVRNLLEPQMAELVAARATKEDLDRIVRSFDKLRNAGTQAEYKIAGYDFQITVAQATRNPLLVAIYELIVAARSQLGWQHLKSVSETDDDRAERNKRTQQFIEALTNRDRNRAVQLARLRLDDLVMAAMGPAPAPMPPSGTSQVD